MNTISLKMPDPLAAELAEMAQRRGVSKSALIREALEAYLQTDGAEPAGSALSQVGDLRAYFPGLKTCPRIRTTCGNSAVDQGCHSRHGSAGRAVESPRPASSLDEGPVGAYSSASAHLRSGPRGSLLPRPTIRRRAGGRARVGPARRFGLIVFSGRRNSSYLAVAKEIPGRSHVSRG